MCLLWTSTKYQLDQRLAGLIDEAGKGMIIVVSKWDSVEGKDAYTAMPWRLKLHIISNLPHGHR